MACPCRGSGKSGPLFDFTVKEDIRVTNDATQEKQDSHAGKVSQGREKKERKNYARRQACVKGTGLLP